MRRPSAACLRRVQFTPDLVPADLVGTRVYRPDTGRFDTELGPVFTNFLLADEINRAPAKVAVGAAGGHAGAAGDDRRHYPSGAAAVPAMATQNPIESEGTYPLPEAQLDRFLMKILVDYPSPSEEAAVVGRSLAPRRSGCLTLPDLARFAAARGSARRPRADRLRRRARRRHARSRRAWSRATSQPLIEFGASPRGPIGLVGAARVLALFRGRGHVDCRRRPRPRGRRAAAPHRALL